MRIHQVISVTDVILALAAFYGLSGAFFKVYRSLASIKYNYTGRQKNPQEAKLDIELTRMVTDVFAFTLISTGFLIEVMNASFTFSVNLTLLLIFGILQNGYTWSYGSSLGNIRPRGSTGHSLLYEGISIGFIFYIFPFFIADLFYYGTFSIYGKLASLFLFLLPLVLGYYTFFLLREMREQKPISRKKFLIPFLAIISSLAIIFH